MRYKREKAIKKNTMAEPPNILMVLLNSMQLHIKVLHISKQGQASGKIINNKLVTSEVGTQYEGFGRYWTCRCIPKLWPEEIITTAVSQQD